MTAIPENVLSALDRLNGHARAWGCGRKAIYAYKTLAAIRIALAGELAARPVSVEAKCITCGGSGLYTDWEHTYKGQTVPHHSPCRKCARKGTVTLRFVETVFGAYCWHHPATGGGHEILQAIGGAPRDADGFPIYEPIGNDWQPNRPAEKLPADEAVALLNLVEAWICDPASAPIGESPWPRERARQEMRRYSLSLNRDRGGIAICAVCGELKDRYISLGRMAWRLDWAQPCCRECYDGKRHAGILCGEAPPPDGLLTPDIRTWLNRRGIDLTKPWKPDPSDYQDRW